MAEARLPRSQHDALTRHVFCRPRAAAIVLRRVLPRAMLEALELDTLELLSSAHARPSLGNRDGDLLFAVRLRGHHGASSIRIAFEHYSSLTPLQPWRALVYATEHWGRHIREQLRPPRTLPFILPVVLVQPPARGAPLRLSDLLELPAHLRQTFGAPFEVRLHVDDLSGSVLHDPDADAGHLALVEITRALLHAYGNDDSLTHARLAALAPCFDTVLVHFGSAELTELWTYVVKVYGADSPLCSIIQSTCRKAVREMYMTIADDLRAKGMAEGRAKGMAEGRAKGMAEGRAKGMAEGLSQALLQVLEHRALPLPRALRERVVTTLDESLLRRWFQRALSAQALEDVFDA